jgi:hypothetical protein
MAKELVHLDVYNIIHIRCPDEFFDKEFHSDRLLKEIAERTWEPNTVILSSNHFIKKEIHNVFGFLYIDNRPVHSGYVLPSSDLLTSTILDYIILSNASTIHCFSYYPHGSGFSEQCAVLHNIPYTMTYLDNT